MEIFEPEGTDFSPIQSGFGQGNERPDLLPGGKFQVFRQSLRPVEEPLIGAAQHAAGRQLSRNYPAEVEHLAAAAFGLCIPGPSTQYSPSSDISFFQTGTVCFRRSMAN